MGLFPRKRPSFLLAAILQNRAEATAIAALLGEGVHIDNP